MCNRAYQNVSRGSKKIIINKPKKDFKKKNGGLKMTRYDLLEYLFKCKRKVSATEIEKRFNINYFEFNDAIKNLKMEYEIDSNLKSVEADNWLSKERNEEVYYSLTPL